MEFKPKDVVTVAGYAVPMTVEEVSGDDVWCVSRDAKGKWQRDKFKAAALTKFVPRGAVRIRL